jgi:hypothetical protein
VKWLIIGAVVLFGGVVFIALKRRFRDAGDTFKSVGKCSSQCSALSLAKNRSDEEITNGLTDSLKEIIITAQGGLPKELSSSWFENDLREICQGDGKLLREFVEGFIAASKNDLVAAAREGEEIDADRMEPNRELPAGYKVAELMCPGIKRAATGEILMKAVVE